MSKATTSQDGHWSHADPQGRSNPLSGIKLVRTLRGHRGWIGVLAWSPDGQILASPSSDRTIRLWRTDGGELIDTLEGHLSTVFSVAWSPDGQMLASASRDGTVRLWDIGTAKEIAALEGHTDSVRTIAWSPNGTTIASGARDSTVRLWDVATRKTVHTLTEHAKSIRSVAWSPNGNRLASASGDKTILIWDTSTWQPVGKLLGHTAYIFSVAWSPDSRNIASGSGDKTIRFWDPEDSRLTGIIEGHTGRVNCVTFSFDGRLLASKGEDGTIRLTRCDTREAVAQLPEPGIDRVFPGIAFDPSRPLLATLGENDAVIRIWELDTAALLGQTTGGSFSYRCAKAVLVGDSGVGKTGLGWRLAHGEFKEHSSTHGQQFWLLNQLCHKREDGTQCETVLWDLAGQPDYRLIHALFLDDADLALVLFDPTREGNPLSAAEFWLKQLKVGNGAGSKIKALLVAARCDRGTACMTQEEIVVFCRQRGIPAFLSTSAKDGDGIDELVEEMKGSIRWDNKPSTVTTATFKQIKDYVLKLKERRAEHGVIVSAAELQISAISAVDWDFTDGEMLTAVGHLANHGYVTLLKSSKGEQRILLAPELLNNLAASFVLEARRNPNGLGSLEEEKLLSGGYKFPELERLTKPERDILLDSATVMFLEHNICFRETDPLLGRAYLVFPELINHRYTNEDEKALEDGVAYVVGGAVENVYASLVVLMGYTQAFTRRSQWRSHARYEVGNGQVCGFRLEAERAGELELVLYFGTDTEPPVRMLFQGLFESFLARRNLTLHRFEPVACTQGHVLNRAVVREQLSDGAKFTFCHRCGEKVALAKAEPPGQLTRRQAEEVKANRSTADHRSRFEQVIFRLKTYVTEQNLAVPECFISYAWGNAAHERWVEKSLATDLQKGGMAIVLDRWENARIGASVPRFVERVGECDRVIVVGTPLYRTKYDNKEPMRSFVAAAEGDLIGERLMGTERDKENVLPVLLEGTKESAFPRLLHPRVYADFRRGETYFKTALTLLLSLYQIQPQDPVAVDLYGSLGEGVD